MGQLVRLAGCQGETEGAPLRVRDHAGLGGIGPGVTYPSGRRARRLRDLQHHLGLALGGEAGARLARRLSAPTSPDTLLRLACSRRSDEIAPAPSLTVS